MTLEEVLQKHPELKFMVTDLKEEMDEAMKHEYSANEMELILMRHGYISGYVQGLYTANYVKADEYEALHNFLNNIQETVLKLADDDAKEVFGDDYRSE